MKEQIQAQILWRLVDDADTLRHTSRSAVRHDHSDMGYSQSSLAVKGTTPGVVLTALGLQSTGKREEFPESPLTAANLPSGWFLVVLDRDAQDIISDEMLRQLSMGCEVVTSVVEEHVMASESTCWRDGKRVWRVYHDSNSRIDHLQIDGEVPFTLAAIRDRLSTKQRAAGGKKACVDYFFEIPVELAMSFTGFRHDADTPGLANDAFEVLEQTLPVPVKKNFFQRLFAKRRQHL
jgi:hypothetical protein